MLSRRNIRVKVMQTLYSVEAMETTKPGEPDKIFHTKIEDTHELLSYLATYLTQVALYAESYAIRKANKHLPTESDRSVNTKIAGNTILWEILGNASFKKSQEKFKTLYLFEKEQIRKSFLKLLDTPEYKEYISIEARDRKSEKGILEFILENLMLSDADFLSDGEEKLIQWTDDMDAAIVQLKIALDKPSAVDFLEPLSEDKMAFGLNLLHTVTEKNEYCLELIKPKLRNWDVERIALLDMILMKMGVCELLYFETIPTKVTLNEYIDIAKEYSTEKSGHFINGILDNIHKELEVQNKIHKKSFNKTLK